MPSRRLSTGGFGGPPELWISLCAIVDEGGVAGDGTFTMFLEGIRGLDGTAGSWGGPWAEGGRVWRTGGCLDGWVIAGVEGGVAVGLVCGTT